MSVMNFVPNHNILASEIDKYEQRISGGKEILIREYRIAQLLFVYTGKFVEEKP